MFVSFDASAFQVIDEHVDRSHILVSCDDHTVDLEIVAPKSIDEAQNLQIVGDAKIMARLVSRYIASEDTDDDF